MALASKTYTVCLNAVTATPAEIISVWKKDFGSFWPKGNKFYGSLIGIAPGNTPLISTGVMVIYADLGCRLGVVHKTEDAHLQARLTNLARHFGITNFAVTQTIW